MGNSFVKSQVIFIFLGLHFLFLVILSMFYSLKSISIGSATNKLPGKRASGSRYFYRVSSHISPLSEPLFFPCLFIFRGWEYTYSRCYKYKTILVFKESECIYLNISSTSQVTYLLPRVSLFHVPVFVAGSGKRIHAPDVRNILIVLQEIELLN